MLYPAGNKPVKMIHNSSKRDEGVENRAERLRNTEARMRRSNKYLIRVPEGEMRENGVETITVNLQNTKNKEEVVIRGTRPRNKN